MQIGRPPVEGQLERTIAAMRHRGPDAQSVIDIDGIAAFAHARLAIIDVDPRSNQPFRDPSGRYTLTYNGEVYNFAALKSELRALGHEFATTSDTEVVLHAFMAWNDEAFAKLEGMFALAIWDRQERRLVLARDRFGEKPLYWSLRPDGAFVFASELRPLLVSGLVPPKEPPLAALNHYLALGYVLAPLSAHPDVRKQRAATILSYTPGGRPVERRYWRYADAFRRAPPPRLTFDDAARDLAALCERAVSSRLVADVPVGSFLSGGLDSSLVTAIARRHVPYALHTFSVGFESRTYDESADALRVARHLSTIHHAVHLRTQGGAEQARRASLVYDEPFADTSLVPMVAVARVASEHVRVVLSGDGADEIFAGYPTYLADRAMALLARTPRRARLHLARSVRRWVREGGGKTSLRFQARQFARGLPLAPGEAHYAWREIHDEPERVAILGRDNAEEVRQTSPVNAFIEHYREVQDLSPLAQHLYVDAMTWLTDDVLVKVDRATMASSLESRAPFLALDLVEYAASLPDRFKLGLRRGKRVLRAAAGKLLPAETVAKPKSGFSAPINDWLGTSSDNEYREFNRRVLAWRAEARS